MNHFSLKGFIQHHFGEKSGAGFTLVETVVYVAVLSLLLSSIGTFSVWILRVNTKVIAMEEVISNAERVKDSITQEARQAVSLYALTTNSSQLSLETKANLPAGETNTFVDFFLCNQQICKKTESQNPMAITSGSVRVSQFQVTEVASSSSKKSLQIHLVIEYPNPGNRPEATASQDITFSVAIR